MKRDTAYVAMIQMKVVYDDWRKNLEHADELLRQVCRERVDFAVLPECCDIGWGNPKAAELACAIPGAVSDALCGMAGKYGIYLVSGITERTKDGIYNAALLISPDGEILGKHRKINVCYDVTDVYPSATPGVFNTPWGRIGMDICADNFMNNTAVAHTLARMGARMILSPPRGRCAGARQQKTPTAAIGQFLMGKYQAYMTWRW